MKATLRNIKSQFQSSLVKNNRRNFMERVKGFIDKYTQPQSSNETNHSLLDSNLSMYTEVRQFRAFLTRNAYDMSIYNESECWPHTNFGTIDNPLLIFGADTTWRMVGCSGPASDEESSSHEKMFFIVREGPIHRCLFCGQCFKLVKLKDDLLAEENTFYSSIFTQISDQVVGSFEDLPIFTYAYTQKDVKDYRSNIMPRDRVFAFLNADEADHLMVDPAYRMEMYKNLELDYYKKRRASGEIMRQQQLCESSSEKHVLDKQVYETWVNIEREILRFDRVYNRFEKFIGRKLFDPENHERRERRMLQRKAERENENYTFYSEGLTEKEQMYRDYYESDIEEYPDNDIVNEYKDNSILRNRGDFDHKDYVFAEANTSEMTTLPVDSFVEKLLFKYKYRMFSDVRYSERSERVSKRAFERASSRDPHVVSNLGDKIEEIYARKGLLQDYSQVEDELLPYASYVAEEGLQQFKDYYESDIENGNINSDLLEDLNERDRIKFSECYVNEYNKRCITDKLYIMIPKRPYDSNKSIVNNFILDLVDFNYRVKPIARNLVFRDTSAKYESLPVNQEEKEIHERENARYLPILEFKKSSFKNNKI